MDQVADATPTPGGGTVAALAGAMASALPVMVANLTIGKKKFAAAEPELRQVKARAEALRTELVGLARRDSEAFEAVLAARRLPQATPAEETARGAAVAAAELGAARVPLETAAACLEVVGLAAVAARLGNPNAVSDAGVAGHLAASAARGALLNVQINLKTMVPGADKNDVEKEMRRLNEALGPAVRECTDAVSAVLGA